MRLGLLEFNTTIEPTIKIVINSKYEEQNNCTAHVCFYEKPNSNQET